MFARETAGRLVTKKHAKLLSILSVALVLCNALVRPTEVAADGLLGGGGGSGSANSSSQMQLQGNVGGLSGSLNASGSIGSSGSSSSGGSGSSGSSSSASASGSLSAGSGGSSLQASGSASISSGSTTSKPEGIFGKMKELVKSSVGLSKDESSSSKPKESSNSESSAQMSASLSASSSSSSSQATTSKPEGGLMELAKKAKEKLTEAKEEIKSTFKSSDDKQQQQQQQQGSSSGASLSASASISAKSGSSSSGQGKSENVGEKVENAMTKGKDMIRETVQKIEEKAQVVGDKIAGKLDENIFKPMASVSGSGQGTSEGHETSHAQFIASLKGEERERYMMELKRRQESEFGQRPSKVKDIIAEAKAKGIIAQSEDRSVLRDNHADEKSVTVEVLDKVHEISKVPVERVLRPLDKALGYEKDPLLRVYDNSHELLRRPLSVVARPMETVLTGAFRTSEESKSDNERLLQTESEQERMAAKQKEERARKENRSVVGDIADKTIELAEKPFEIILKPVDHALGLDKNGRKNPILKLVDQIYGLSKKPLDAVAKPIEEILKKMGDDNQYQVSVRFAQQAEEVDPKIVTRLADGALNIADRVITRPLEIVMKPLNHALGYDEPGKKNPILDAAHSLKNATKVGLELFTKPIDRIIKEIAELGAITDESDRENEIDRRHQEASRLVRALDKLHQAVQQPWEIVLRPVDRVMGIRDKGRKDPFLRAWDVIHEVVRTPIQVVSKPVEDAFLGEQKRSGQQQRSGASLKAEVKIGNTKIGGKLSAGTSSSNNNQDHHQQQQQQQQRTNLEKPRKNFIVDGIKRVEKLAARPIDVVTSPIRRLILGEDDIKVGSELDKNNRAIQAKIQGINRNRDRNEPDRIVKTIESMNSVVLKPLELITQPIADMISPDNGSSQNHQKQQDNSGHMDLKVKGQVSAQQGRDSKQLSASAQFKKS